MKIWETNKLHGMKLDYEKILEIFSKINSNNAIRHTVVGLQMGPINKILC